MNHLSKASAPTALLFVIFACHAGIAQAQSNLDAVRDPEKRLQLFANYDVGRAALLTAAGAECVQADSELKILRGAHRENLPKELELARHLDQCMQRAVGQARSIAATENTAGYLATDALLSPYTAESVAELAAAQANVDYTSLTWGLGFGASQSFDDAIEKASIVNGIVRVEDDQTLRTRVLLEFHQYFWTGKTNKNLRWGTGPFLAIAAGTGDTVMGVGLGWMWGLKSADPQQSEGFSIGIGVLLDDDVKTLGAGFEENQPPPAGETAVRFEEKARPAAVLIVTRTF